MPKIAYIKQGFQKKSLAIIDKVNAIIGEYQAAGYELTLRQVYYQLVSRNEIPNSEKSYDNLGALINKARLAGLIDWLSIEDRTRYLRQLPHWDNPEEIISDAANSYRIDLWQGQKYYLEIWCEKDALIGVVEQAANRHDTPCFSCRGFVSASEMWIAAQRIIEQAGRHCIVLHLGDHDPSGLDMTRDIADRLHLFGADVEIIRLALNMNQIEQYKLPPNPAKLTDSRARKYIEQYGGSSWELDALEPSVLDDLISSNILRYLDTELYESMEIRQAQERQQLLRLIE